MVDEIGAPVYSPAMEDSLADLGELVGHRSELPSEGETRIRGPVVGRLVGLTKAGEPLVDFPGNTALSLRTARSTITVSEGQIGREILLAFEEGYIDRPIITGFMEVPGPARETSVKLNLDDERLVFTAEREIVLQCGGASITLTRAGKVLIRGSYVLTRSSGANRIKGASVQIN